MRIYNEVFNLWFVSFIRYIKIGDKEVEFHPQFRLILHTKLANPHYKPEMQAQTSLINFTVTIDGLEDQLLANVVRLERPDLEELKVRTCEECWWLFNNLYSRVVSTPFHAFLQ